MARIEELQAYCLVIEEKSFSKAAARLRVSQPAVSMQIKNLESEYNEKLLHRDGKEILPTESGKLVYQYAVQIIDLDRKSKQIVRETREKAAGNLNFGASSGPGERLLPRILGLFKERYPQSAVSLRVGDSAEIINDVLKYRYELGLVGNSRRDGQLQFDPFLRDELVLAVSPGHPWADHRSQPVDFSAVRQEPMILQQYGSGATSLLIDVLDENGLSIHDLNISMELGLQESVRTAVENGLGVSFISRLGILEELELGKLVEIPIEGLRLERYFYILYLKNEPLTNLAETFLEFARQQAAEILPQEFLI